MACGAAGRPPPVSRFVGRLAAAMGARTITRLKAVSPTSRCAYSRRVEQDEDLWSKLIFVSIVCTDRGQHRRTRLTTARMRRSERGMNWPLERFAPPVPDAKPQSFVCPRCTRTPQVKTDKWWMLLEAVVMDHQKEFDISLLP